MTAPEPDDLDRLVEDLTDAEILASIGVPNATADRVTIAPPYGLTAPEPEVIARLTDDALCDESVTEVLTSDLRELLLSHRALATRCAAAETLAKENAGIVSGLLAMLHNTKADLTAARAQVAAMEVDAKRLDFLESAKVFQAAFYPLENPPRWELDAWDTTTGATLREAIDAALPIPTPQPEQDDA